MRVLLVEDEPRLVESLEYILKKEKYLVDIATDGINGNDAAKTGIYDVIILDRMLPRKDGLEILRDLRAQNITSAIIFLTAKDTVANRIEGLDAGADDYLVKPFSNGELLARVRALGRRYEKNLLENDIQLGLLTLQTKECLASTPAESIKLSFQETQLLEFLLRNKSQVLSKEQILNKVWGFDKDVELKNVELYIFYLRKKINFKNCHLELKTIRNMGYVLLEL